VQDFTQPGGQKVVAKPFLDNNAFGAAGAAIASAPPTRPAGGATEQ
jgi:hypothetical protein